MQPVCLGHRLLPLRQPPGKVGRGLHEGGTDPGGLRRVMPAQKRRQIGLRPETASKKVRQERSALRGSEDFRVMEWDPKGEGTGSPPVARAQIGPTDPMKLKRQGARDVPHFSLRLQLKSGSKSHTPLFVNNTVYLATPFYRIFALGPDASKVKLTYDTESTLKALKNRGVAYWPAASAGRRPALRETGLYRHDGRQVACGGCRCRQALPGFWNRRHP